MILNDSSICHLLFITVAMSGMSSSRQEEILTEIRNNPNVTQPQLSQLIGIGITAIENNIKFLKENGYIERVGSNKTGYWKVNE